MFSILGAAAIAVMSANEPPPAEPSVTEAPVHAELEASAYAESGSEYFGSNEVEDVYREHAAGLGVLGTVRFGSSSGAAIPSGALLLFGVTSEWRALETTLCGYSCAAPRDRFQGTHALSGAVGLVDQASPDDHHVYEAHGSLRVGLGD